MEKFLLVHVSSQVLALSALIIFIGLALGGLFLVRHSVGLSTLERHNDVAGFIIAVIGVLYAVLLAFVVVVSWQNFDGASSTASHEAEIVSGLYRDASVFGAQGPGIRRSLENYAVHVVTREWTSMRVHQYADQQTDEALDGVWAAYRSYAPQNPTEEAFYTDSIRRLNDLQAARSDRLEASDSQLPSILWGVLLGGAIITIGFTYFFGVPNLRAHALMVAALAAIISLTLFLVLSLDLPFSGGIAVPPTSMTHAIAEMHHYAGEK